MHHIHALSLPALLAVAAAVVSPAVAKAPSYGDNKGQPELCSSNATYDYVIVGGGTAGLVVANRLAETSKYTVAVIEAGPSGKSNPDVEYPGLFGTVFGTPLDWNYTTIPQPELNGRSVYHPRGRILGGSSAVNGLAHTRPKKSELDAWEQLGNPGWNWNNLFKYAKQAEKFQCPSIGVQEQYGIGCVPEYHGESGPYQYTFTNYRFPQEKLWLQTANNAGLRNVTHLDGMGGDQVGAGFFPAALNHTNQFRVDTEYAFLPQPIPRLSVLANTTATKILWSDASWDEPIASGVEVVGPDGSPCSIRARKEVILSAGSFNSPKLLELSGVGSKKVLQAQGIPVAVENDNVGENMQDHSGVYVTFKIQDQYPTYSTVLTNPAFLNSSLAEFVANQTGLIDYAADAIGWIPGEFYVKTAMNSSQAAVGPTSSSTIENITATINSYNASVSANMSSVRPGLAEQWQLQAQHFLEWPQTELYWTNAYLGASLTPPDNSTYVTFVMASLHPFSRGSVHINSTDPSIAPVIDMAYYKESIDAKIGAAGAAVGRKVSQTQPLASIVVAETSPNTTVVPQDSGIEAWETYARSVATTIYHPVGSLSMLPQDKGGVVDSSLCVYGTKGLRVVDASIIPLIPATHLVSTIIAIAERAADIIKSQA